MGRKLRYLPDDNHLVAITGRTMGGRFLLRPSPRLNAIVHGALARSQERHGMKVCAVVYLSNHCHLLLRPESVEQLAGFMRDVNAKIAKEAGRLHGWSGALWGRPYTDGVVSHEPGAQIGCLRYLLEQGCKERLVASPKHWPGASSTKALLRGEAIEGIWIDRSGQHRAREGSKPHTDGDFTTRYKLELSPIPCWAHLEPHQYQAKIRSMVREIEGEMEGVPVLGREAILAQNPLGRPVSNPPRTPAPRFHAVEARTRRALELAYRSVVSAYRQASEAFRAGKTAEFPPGCFVPGRFVPLRA